MSLDADATLKNDLSYLKKLAEDGRGAPAPMALFLAGWGLLYGLGNLVQWSAIQLELAGLTSFPTTRQTAAIWWPIHILALLLLGVSLVQTFRPGAARTRVNRIAAVGWAAAFAALVAVVVCEIIMGRAGNNYYGLNLLPCFLLILWGFAWAVSAAATGRNWLYAVSGGSFIAAIAWAALWFDSVHSMLLGALCYLLLAFLPGAILMRRP